MHAHNSYPWGSFFSDNEHCGHFCLLLSSQYVGICTQDAFVCLNFDKIMSSPDLFCVDTLECKFTFNSFSNFLILTMLCRSLQIPHLVVTLHKFAYTQSLPAQRNRRKRELQNCTYVPTPTFLLLASLDTYKTPWLGFEHERQPEFPIAVSSTIRPRLIYKLAWRFATSNVFRILMWMCDKNEKSKRISEPFALFSYGPRELSEGVTSAIW